MKKFKIFFKRFAIVVLRPLERALCATSLDINEKKIEEIKCRFQSLGTHVKISSNSTIIEPNGIVVGNNVHIGDECFIHAEGGLLIQDNVHISRRVTIYCSDHEFRNGQPIPFGPYRVWRQTVIERNVWIGMNVCILPGVRIGEGAIIGMGSVVSRDVPPRGIVGQQPYRILGHRDEVEYNKAEHEARYGGRNGLSALVEHRPAPLIKGEFANVDITFVLTTGRSGSTSIVDFLKSEKKVDCRHEPRHQLIQWSTEFAHGEASRAKTLNRLKELYLRTSVYQEGICYLESDQKNFNLVHLLVEVFPKAKFIWLTRDGRDVVASATARGWYADENHSVYNRIPYFYHKHRLNGDLCGSVDSKSWSEMSAFARNCWYWSFVNSTIREQLSKISDERWIRVRVEEIEAESSRITKHLGLSSTTLVEVHSNKAFYSLRNPEQWSQIESKTFERLCGDEMKLLYG